jgi:predicted RNA-binding Zn-ribbon protein involved in translation (DUF1610 family)
MSEEIKCPKCGSTQITSNKQGFSGKKAVAGAILTGGVGLLAGTLGSNKVKITCLSCGHTWAPGEHIKATPPPANDKGCAVLIFIATVIMVILALLIKW